MTQNADTTSPRQDSPEKTAAEQKLKKMGSAQNILGLAFFCTVALLYVSRFRGWPVAWEVYIVMAGLFSLLLNGIHGLRWFFYERSSRAKRGLCRKCTYDLTGIEAPTLCPECGTKIDRPPGSNMR